MNKIKTLVLGSVLAASTVASSVAMAGASANVAITTDYVFRGISYSDGGPALQGGFDYDFENGFAVGIWGSSIATVSSSATDSDQASESSGLEVDLYASYSGEINGVGYSVGYTDYRTESTDEIASTSLGEAFAGVSYAGFGLTYYNGDSTLGADYLELTYGMDLSDSIALGLSVGNTDFDDASDDVRDYKIALSTEVGGYGMELAFTDTNVNNPTDAQDNHVFFTISKSM